MPDARFSLRTVFLCGFLFCAALIAVALYLQYVRHLEPCPLCIIQRVQVIALGLLMLAGAVQDPSAWGRRVYGALILLVAGSGIAVAGRHVWLQHLPADQVPSCGPGLSYMLEKFPLHRTLALVFRGSGECATVNWTFVGLSIPGWTLIIFCVLALYGAFLALRPPPSAAEA